MSNYGDSDRLDPEDARRLIQDLVHHMRQRSWYIFREDPEKCLHQNEDGPSEAKEVYGDTWTLLFGISAGINLMKDERSYDYDWDRDERIDHGIRGDDTWEEHYDQYGYGVYGRGLEIGKRLAFYEDRDFDFSSEKSDSEESSFTIKTYN